MPTKSSTRPQIRLGPTPLPYFDAHGRPRPVSAAERAELARQPVWTVPEFAVVKRISKTQAYALALADDIPGCTVEKLGGAVRINRDEYMSPSGDAA